MKREGIAPRFGQLASTQDSVFALDLDGRVWVLSPELSPLAWRPVTAKAIVEDCVPRETHLSSRASQ